MPLLLTDDLKKRLYAQHAGKYDESKFDIEATGEETYRFIPKAQPSFQPPAPDETTAELGAANVKPSGGPSVLESGARAAATSVIPTAAGIGGALGGAGLASMLFPEPVFSKILGAGLLGLAGSFAGSKLQEAVVPQSIQEKLFTRPQDVQENPVSTAIGNLVPTATTLRPSLADIKTLGSGLRNMSWVGQGARGALTPEQIAALANAGVGVGIAGGMEAHALSEGKPFNPLESAINVLPGALFTRPTALGTKLGFGSPEVNKAPVMPDEPAPSKPTADATVKPTQARMSGQTGEGVVISDGQVIPVGTTKLKEPDLTGEVRGKDPYQAMSGNTDDTIVGQPRPSKSAVDSAVAMESAPLAEKKKVDYETSLREKAKQDADEVYRKAFEEAAEGKLIGSKVSATPERRPSPIATTETGKEILPDYTGVQEHDVQVNAKTPKSEAEWAQESFDRLDDNRRKYQAEQEGEALAQQEKLLSDIEAEATRRQLKVRYVPEIKIGDKQKRGYYDPKTREVVISKSRATQDTPSHEVGHGYVDDLLASPEAKDHDFVLRGLEFADDAGRKFKTKKDWEALTPEERTQIDERFVQLLGEEGAKQRKAELYGTKREKFSKWLENVGSNVKNKLGMGSAEDRARSVAVSQRHDLRTIGNKSENGTVLPAPKFQDPGDYEQYQEVQAKIKSLIAKGDFESPEFQALWKENEVIKNRNKGHVPKPPEEGGKKFQDDQTATPEFKQWFGDSKVVDGEGKPKKLFHGTMHDFTEISKSKFDPNALFGPGFYMTENAEVAGGDTGYAFKGSLSRSRAMYKGEDFNYDPKKSLAENTKEVKRILKGFGHPDEEIDTFTIKPSKDGQSIQVFDSIEGSPNTKVLYAKIDKPFDMDKSVAENVDVDKFIDLLAQNPRLSRSLGLDQASIREDTLIGIRDDSEDARDWYRDNIRDNNVQVEFSNVLKKLGFDGITHTGGVNRRLEHKVWIAFEPYKIKSATGNSGAFDPKNPDIRFQSDSEKTTNEPLLLSSRFDKVARLGKTGKEVSEKLKNFQSESEFLQGKYGNKVIAALKGYDETEIANVYKYRHAVSNGLETSNLKLSANEQKLKNTLDSEFKSIGEDIIASGLEVKDSEDFRKMKLKPDGYQPNIIAQKVIHAWQENTTDAPKYDKLYTDYMEKKGLTEAEAMTQLKEYKQAVGNAGVTPDIRFNAIRKAEGLGLPFELVEQNPALAFRRYGRRAANDVSYFKYLQNDPRMLKALGIRDQHGKSVDELGADIQDSAKDVTWIGGSEEVKSALRSVYGIDTPMNQRGNAAIRAIANSVIQTGAAIRNIVGLPTAYAGYYGVTPKTLVEAITKMSERSSRAFESNAVRSSFKDFDAAGIIEGHPDRFVELADKYSNTMRKWTGRDLSDKFEGELSYSLGETLAVNWLAQAKAGDIKARRMLNRFGGNVEGGIKEKFLPKAAVSHEDISRIAKNFVDATRGSYGPSGLPSSAIEGGAAPMLSLARWSIEKFNTFQKDVVRPITEHGDWMPLLKTTFAGLLTGAAIEKLNELLSQKKGADATIEETWADGDIDAITHKVIGLLQLGGFAGILSDTMKATSAWSQGKDLAFSNPISMPALTLAEELFQNSGYAFEAAQQGEDKLEVLSKFLGDILKTTYQNARYVSNVVNKEETERKGKFRDLRVFRELEGKPPGDSSAGNPYLGMAAREFKRAEDLETAASKLPRALETAVKKAKGNYEDLVGNVEGLRKNSYQTFPADPMEASKYYQYLVKTIGVERANMRYADYLRQTQMNKEKTKMVPKLKSMFSKD